MAEITDDALPVFPFRVNWKEGISERLEWKTDVLADFKGNEQRRALRLTPRREFEVQLALWGEDRQFWDLWLHRMAGTEFLFPVWHDSVRAAQAAPQGQKTIWVDTRGLEFQIGSYGLLRGVSALSYERFKIAEVHDDRIVTVSNLAATWRRGTRVEPLIRGRMTDQTDVKALSSRVSTTRASLETTRAQPIDEGVDSFDQYGGFPVLALPPNRSEDVSASFRWAFSETDSDTGRRFRRSDTGRAIVHQKHGFFLRGRTAKRLFRQLAYRLRGAAKPIWLPTFNEDMTLSRNAGVAAGSIYVKAFGFAYTGGVSSGREHICIQLRNGTRLYRRITGTAVSGSLTEERLTLDTPLPGGLAMADVGRISWMDAARFENDKLEFNHVNAADGMTTVAGIFKTFRNERTPPAVLSLPIPQATKIYTNCGPDAPENDICAPVFQGIYLTVTGMGGVNRPQCNPCWDGDRYMTIAEIQPNGPGGRVFSTEHFYGGGCNPYGYDVYEVDNRGADPNGPLQGQLMLSFRSNNFNSWSFYYYFPCQYVNVNIFPSARYCGSVGQDEGDFAVMVTYTGSPPIMLGPQPAGGLYNMNFPL